MRTVSFKGLAYSIALGAMATAMAQPALAKDDKQDVAAPEVSKEFRKAAEPVQKALDAKDYATAASALPAAEAAAQSPDEKNIAAHYRLTVAAQNKDQAAQRAAVETILASGKGDPTEVPGMNFYLGNAAYVDGKYERAETLVEQAIALGYTENNAELVLADIYLKRNRLDDAFALARKVIAAKNAAGEVVPEDWYKRPAAAAQKAGRTDDFIDFLTLRLQSYNSPESWRTTGIYYLKSVDADKATTLDTLRLLAATDALTTRAEFYEWASLAVDSGIPGEVATAYKLGADRGIITTGDSEFATLSKQQSAKIAADMREVEASVKAAPAAANGVDAKSAGDALLGYGDYGRAMAMYRLALDKGGVDSSLVNLRLGIALARTGDFAAAKQSFGAVTGPRKSLARLWSAYADMKMSAAATPASPAPAAN